MQTKSKKNRTTENSGGNWQIPIDQFHIPFTINWICPHCDEVNAENLEKLRFLRRPYINREDKLPVACIGCDFTGHVKFKLNLKLEIPK